MNSYVRSAVLASVAVLTFAPGVTRAGVDLSGPITAAQIAADGTLWFRFEAAQVDQYCRRGWFGFNMYVPAGDPSFPYLYSMVMTAVTKARPVYVANIGTFNGTTRSDITRTGYGLVIS